MPIISFLQHVTLSNLNRFCFNKGYLKALPDPAAARHDSTADFPPQRATNVQMPNQINPRFLAEEFVISRVCRYVKILF